MVMVLRVMVLLNEFLRVQLLDETLELRLLLGTPIVFVPWKAQG